MCDPSGLTNPRDASSQGSAMGYHLPPLCGALLCGNSNTLEVIAVEFLHYVGLMIGDADAVVDH